MQPPAIFIQIKKSGFKTSTAVLAVLVYLAAGMLLLPMYRYQINPDAITYISIAQKYARGDFYNAINGHAYPLISWLLVPFILGGIDPLLATKILNLILGSIAVFGLQLLFSRFSVNEKVRRICFFSIIPGVIYFAYSVITPDLLLATLLLFYHAFVYSPGYSQKNSRGMLCGLVGGMAYLAKSYSLLFFLCHFTLINCYYYFKNTASARKTILCNFGSGMLVFLIICGSWAGVISIKYGFITTSNQGSVILSAISPYPSKGPDYLVAPPNNTAVSIWEDPYVVMQKNSWSPFNSRADFRHWMKVIMKNIRNTIWYFICFSPVGFCICLGYVLFLTGAQHRLGNHEGILYILVTTILYAGGYCLLVVNERYLWPLFFLFVIMSSCGLSMLLTKKLFNRKGVAAIILFLFGASYILMPVNNLYTSLNSGKQIYLLGSQLQQYIPPGSKIVSNTQWYESLFLAYHLKSRIYGTADNMRNDKLAKELRTFAIDYFIVWGNSTDTYPFLEHSKEIIDSKIQGLHIYRLKL